MGQRRRALRQPCRDGVGGAEHDVDSAEGSTVFDFQLFYLLQNPQTTATTATIRFLLPSGAPIVRTYDLPARSRTSILVNTVPGLESTDVSAEITATQPIAVERAMYRSGGGQVARLGTTRAPSPSRPGRGSSPKAPPARSSTPSCCWPIPPRSRRR
jgi:hypothetical protein